MYDEDEVVNDPIEHIIQEGTLPLEATLLSHEESRRKLGDYTVGQLFSAIAGAIRARGWTTGEYMQYGGEVCLVGGQRAAMAKMLGDIDNDSFKAVRKSTYALFQQALRLPQRRDTVNGSIMEMGVEDWNDDQDDEEVVIDLVDGIANGPRANDTLLQLISA